MFPAAQQALEEREAERKVLVEEDEQQFHTPEESEHSRCCLSSFILSSVSLVLLSLSLFTDLLNSNASAAFMLAVSRICILALLHSKSGSIDNLLCNVFLLVFVVVVEDYGFAEFNNL